MQVNPIQDYIGQMAIQITTVEAFMVGAMAGAVLALSAVMVALLLRRKHQ